MLPWRAQRPAVRHRRRSRPRTCRSTRSTCSTTPARRTRSARSRPPPCPVSAWPARCRSPRVACSASPRRCRVASATASSASIPTPGTISTDASTTTIEVLNILLGKGNDHLTIESTLVPGIDLSTGVVANHGGLTTVHGGGNSLVQVIGTFDVAGSTITRTDGVVVGGRRLRRRPAGDDLRDPRHLPRRQRRRRHARAGRASQCIGHDRGDRRRARPEDRHDPHRWRHARRDRRCLDAGRRRPGVTARPLRRHQPGRPLVQRPARRPDGRATSGPSRSTRSARPTTASSSRSPSRTCTPAHDVIDAHLAFSASSAGALPSVGHHRLRRRGRRHDHRQPDRRPPRRRLGRRPRSSASAASTTSTATRASTST